MVRPSCRRDAVSDRSISLEGDDGPFGAHSFAAGAQGPQLYLIPEDYLTPSKKGNLLVLLEDFGLVGDGCARGRVEGTEVVRAEQAWG